MNGELRGESITKVFDGGARALDGVSFVAPPGRVLTLLGPSGCGKSTLLRIVAGLEHATDGRLLLDGKPFDAVPAGKRDVGFVFQNYALYPHLTVEGNLSLALRARRMPPAEIAARVSETSQMLGIGDLLSRRPSQLSGGQQQRVALGRALIRRPRLCLLDEPLSNLDALLREGMRTELKALFRRLGATVLYVTHDQSEALSLSDEILVLRQGEVRQVGDPLAVYQRPADLFTATFVGSPRMSVWRAERAGGGWRARGVGIPASDRVSGHSALWVGIRPEDVDVLPAESSDAWPARVELSEPLGDRVLLTLRVGEEALRALVSPRQVKETLWARVAPDKLHFFDVETEKRLES